MFQTLFIDEPGNGAETVEIVIGIICSVGLGAALLAFQTKINTTIENTGKAIDTVFQNLSEGVE